MIQIRRKNFDSNAQKHARGVEEWIKNRIDYAIAVLLFLKKGTALADCWKARPLRVPAVAMGKLLPIATGGTTLGKNNATVNSVLIALSDARTKREVTPKAKNLLNMLAETQKLLGKILVARPTELERIDRKVVSKFSITKDSVEMQLLGWVFDYDWWSKDSTNTTQWRPSNLAKLNHVRTCPYCNRAFTYSSEDSDGTFYKNCEFDHFFGQSGHPMLRMSYFNLVPSCSICNSPGYKGQKNFSFDNNIHPFFNGFGDGCVFVIEGGLEGANPLDWIDRADKLPLTLENRIDPKLRQYQKIENNKAAFKLVSVYKGHGREIEQIIGRYRYYTKEQVKGIAKVFCGLEFEQNQDIRVLFGVISLAGLEKQILSKLTRDILNQLRSS